MLSIGNVGTIACINQAAQWCLKLNTQTQHWTNISAWTYEWKSQPCLFMALKFIYYCTNYRKLQGVKSTDVCVTQIQELWAAPRPFAMCTSPELPGAANGLLGRLKAGRGWPSPVKRQRLVKGTPLPWDSTCRVMPWMLWRTSLTYEATSTEQ